MEVANQVVHQLDDQGLHPSMGVVIMERFVLSPKLEVKLPKAV